MYLDTHDLEYFNFKTENGIPEEKEINEFLFDLMELVHNETGFDPYKGGRVMVEAIHSEHGMRLNICRIGGRSGKKLTREQFERVKNVRAAKRSSSEKLSVEEYDELVSLLRDIGQLRDAVSSSKETFVINGFTSMEAALCKLPDEELANCVLYRSDARYAIVSENSVGSRLRHILGEYADHYHGGDVLADDIDEGWEELVRGGKLIEMAQALRRMQ